MPNRHPVDALADIRSEIKVLRESELLLRAEVLENPDELKGDDHEATICELSVERLDLNRLKTELGMSVLRPFLRQQIQGRVLLKPTPKTRRA